MNAQPEAAAQSYIHAWLGARSPWQRRGLAFLSGAVATLGHAPFQLTFLYLVAIAALVLLLDAANARSKKRWSAFSMGWFFGFGHFASGLYWISAAFDVDSASWGPLWGIPATAALAGGLALFWGLGCALAINFWTNDLRRAPWIAACLFVTEWLRGHVLSGLPWLLPGYVWTPGEPISQLASLIGAYGLTLLTLLAGAALACLSDHAASPVRRFGPTLATALLIGMAWGWGAQHLGAARVDPPGALPIVRVADAGMSQAEKWEGRTDQEWRVLARYLAVSGDPEQSRSEIVVWPEGAIPVVNFFALENREFMDAIGQGLGDRVLIAGLTRREPIADGQAYFNSAAIIDGVSGRARLSQTYDKNHLVPFGEYIPLWSLIGRLNIAPLQRIGAGFEPGAPPTRLVIPGGPPAIVLICYEAIFPGMTPRGEGRPSWIVMITNDAWFGGGSGPYQHYVMARYRAIEEGLPVARAASGGISAIVDAYGRQVVATSIRGGYVEAQLPPALPETIYASWGGFAVPFLLVIFVIMRFVPHLRRFEGSVE
jgi:apolipoprotein N-acyltransferase